MPIPKKILKYLEKNKVKYEIIEHKTVYTAHDISATTKLKLNQIAKNLLIKFNKPFKDGEKPYILAIVSANRNIDLKKLVKVASDVSIKLNKELRKQRPEKGKKQVIDIYNKISKAEISKEKTMKDKFKVVPGKMAALGSIYKVPVFVDKGLKNNLLFSSGSFEQSIKMLVKDFIKLENAFLGNFSIAKKQKKSKIRKSKKAKAKTKR